MADGTAIEWTDATWNVVNGCSVVSPGCTNCYAMRLAGTRLRNHPSRAGLTQDSKAGPVWNGQVSFNDAVLRDPLKWRRSRRIFVCAHGDLFHDAVPDAWIDRVFAVMALAQQHTFQVLTKRPQRARDYLQAVMAMDPDDRDKRFEGPAFAVTQSPCVIGCLEDLDWPLPNVWLGVSVEDQARADERVPLLLDTPAAVRWLSCEPLLGPVDLTPWLPGRHGFPLHIDRVGRGHWGDEPRPDWVVAGGESGPGARPMHPDWARALRDQCKAACAPFLFKQWGNWAPDDGPPASGRDKVFEGSARAAVWRDGAWTYLDNGYQGPVEWCRQPGDWLFDVGKKAAGRLLDGVAHDGFPA